jgi:hypothetical protein
MSTTWSTWRRRTERWLLIAVIWGVVDALAGRRDRGESSAAGDGWLGLNLLALGPSVALDDEDGRQPLHPAPSTASRQCRAVGDDGRVRGLPDHATPRGLAVDRYDAPGARSGRDPDAESLPTAAETAGRALGNWIAGHRDDPGAGGVRVLKDRKTVLVYWKGAVPAGLQRLAASLAVPVAFQPLPVHFP